jgi:hypothetical protein
MPLKGRGLIVVVEILVDRPLSPLPFVSSEPLLQLRAGQVDVDQAALARADDGGAVDLPFLQPLRDTRPADTPRASANSDFRTTGKG